MLCKPFLSNGFSYVTWAVRTMLIGGIRFAQQTRGSGRQRKSEEMRNVHATGQEQIPPGTGQPGPQSPERKRSEPHRIETPRRLRLSTRLRLEITAAAGAHRFALLITDDDQPFRESLGGVFENEGFRTFLAGSGEEAIDIIQGEEVHVALMDQNLPRLTGLQTIRVFRQMNALLPVILVTAENTQQLMHEAILAQAFCVLSKPVRRTEVVHTVHRALAHHYPSFGS